MQQILFLKDDLKYLLLFVMENKQSFNRPSLLTCEKKKLMLLLIDFYAGLSFK